VTKMKTLLGFAVGICALAFLATPALAENFESTSGTYPVKFTAKINTGTQHVFTVEGVEVSCRTAEFKGELTERSRKLEVRPTYRSCTTLITGVKHKTVVNTSGVQYLITIIKPATKPQTARVEVKGNPVITVEGTSCVIKVPAQSGLQKLTLENNTKTVMLKINAEVTGIASEQTKGCGIKEKTTSGTYKGRVEGGGIKVR